MGGAKRREREEKKARERVYGLWPHVTLKGELGQARAEGKERVKMSGDWWVRLLWRENKRRKEYGEDKMSTRVSHSLAELDFKNPQIVREHLTFLQNFQNSNLTTKFLNFIAFWYPKFYNFGTIFLKISN